MKSSRSWIVEPAPIGWNTGPDVEAEYAGQGQDDNRNSRLIKDGFFTGCSRTGPWQKLMIFSNTAIIGGLGGKRHEDEEQSTPKIRPPAIWLKMLGRVMNTSPGPCPGSTPNAKQDGKIISPASRATSVSRRQILIVSPVRVRSLPM